mgnify:FL=1
MNNYRFLQMRVDKLGRKLMTQDELAKILDIDRNRIQQLETSPKVIPKENELRAYCKYFNTTSDYLLNIRDTKAVNENIAMISRATRLNDDSILSVKKLSDMQIAILNELLASDLMSTLLNTILRYVPFDYARKASKDKEEWGYDEWRIIKAIEQILVNVYKNNKLCETARKYRSDIIAQEYGYKNAEDAHKNMKMPEPPE